jgi:hypothetical protein
LVGMRLPSLLALLSQNKFKTYLHFKTFCEEKKIYHQIKYKINSITVLRTFNDQMIGTIHEETIRRKDRLKYLRTSSDLEERRRCPVGILTVRTMEESLACDSTVDSSSKNFKLKRRKLIRKLDDALPDMCYNTESTISSSASALTKSVGFSRISIREFPLLPGDNPSVSGGPPVTLGWDNSCERTFDFHDYENAKIVPPRSQIEMRIPAQTRSNLLREFGHSWKSIHESVRAANISRRQRSNSVERMKSDRIDEKVEKISRGVKHLFKKKVKKPTEPDCLQKSSSTTSTNPLVEKDEIDISFSNSAKKYDLDLEVEEREDLDDKKVGDALYSCSSEDIHSFQHTNRIPTSSDAFHKNKSRHGSKDASNTSPTIFRMKSGQDMKDSANLNDDYFIDKNGEISCIFMNRLENTALRVERNVTFSDLLQSDNSSDDGNEACCGGHLLATPQQIIKAVIGV